MTPDERDLDALLRQPTERLAPPDYSWEQISRRARRRKWVKASLSVAAGVVVVAGAVPAMIAVRASNTNDKGSVQTLSASKSETPAAPKQTSTVAPAPAPSVPSAPAVPSNLVGFRPASVSFVSQLHGYAWGSIGNSPQGVIAQTHDEGVTWTRLTAPAVENSSSPTGDSQIRYESGMVGFVFGAKYFVTTDAGLTWTQAQAPGYIDDLEAGYNQRIWALVRATKDSPTVSLYTAAPGSSALQRVNAVQPMTSPPGADSIAVNHNEVDVVAGSTAFWSTNRRGTHWTQGQSPCPASSGTVRSALLATLNLPGIYAACGYNSGGGQTKQTYLSTNSGKSWTATTQSPATTGQLQTFAAGSEKNVIVGDSSGGAQLTDNGGKTWVPELPPGGIKLSFVGFISTTTIVGVGTTADGSQGAFATSFDSGQRWSVTPFGR